MAERQRARKGSKGTEKGCKGDSRTRWTCGKAGTLQLRVHKAETRTCMPLVRRKVRSMQKLLIMRKSCVVLVGRERASTLATQAEESRACPTAECGKTHLSSIPKTIFEVKDRWVKVRVTMDSAVAGHVMLEGMIPRVKLERRTAPKKLVAAEGGQIRDFGDAVKPLKTM